MRKHCTFVFVVLALLALPGTLSAAQQLRKVKALVNNYIGFAPFFIAQEEGYFREQGLDVEFVRLNTSGESIPALVHGDIDVVAGVIYAAYFNAMAQGVPVRIVADRGHLAPGNCPDHAIVIRSSLPYTHPVPGEVLTRLVYSENSPTAWTGALYEMLLAQSGASPGEINNVFLPTSAKFDALVSGSIDITPVNEPFVTQYADAGVARILVPTSAVAPGFQQAQLFYGTSFLEEDPLTGQAFMNAYLKAVRQFNQGKTKRNLEILAKHTHFEPEMLQRCCWPAIRNDGRIDTHSIVVYQEWFRKKGLIDTVVPVEKFWDPRFVDHANRVLGSAK